MSSPTRPKRRPAEGTPEDPVLAAGVVLWRKGPNGQPEFLLLRNAQHLTWGFAKGHLDADDASTTDAALREVTEETGVQLQESDLHPDFSDSSIYQKASGKWKRVVLALAETPANADIERSHEHCEHGWFCESTAVEKLRHQSLKRTVVRAAWRLRQSPAD